MDSDHNIRIRVRRAIVLLLIIATAFAIYFTHRAYVSQRAISMATITTTHKVPLWRPFDYGVKVASDSYQEVHTADKIYLVKKAPFIGHLRSDEVFDSIPDEPAVCEVVLSGGRNIISAECVLVTP